MQVLPLKSLKVETIAWSGELLTIWIFTCYRVHVYYKLAQVLANDICYFTGVEWMNDPLFLTYSSSEHFLLDILLHSHQNINDFPGVDA